MRMIEKKSEFSTLLLLGVSVSLTIVVLVFSLYQNFFLHSEEMRHVKERVVNENMKGEIQLLHQILMYSAKMAAITSEDKWESRHSIHEEKLANILNEATQITAEPQSDAAVAQTKNSYNRLRTLESEVFELIRAGKNDKARQVFLGNAYRAQALIAEEGLERLLSRDDLSIRLAQLASTINVLDEVLTMSAKLAAASGSFEWEKQYYDSAVTLDSLIEEALEISLNDELLSALENTKQANQKLIAMEKQSFALVRKGNFDAGNMILNSETYQKQKDIYRSGMEQFMAILQSQIHVLQERTIANQRNKIVYSGSAILLLTISWIVVLWFVKRSQSLRKNEQSRFRLMIDAAPTGMIMIDLEGIIVLVNQLIVQQFGYPEEELLGQKIELLLPERFRLNHPELRNSFFKTPESRQMGQGRELYAQKKDGKEFPVEIGLNPLKIEDGNYVLASVVDITDRKHVLDVLLESEETNRLIIESAPNGMVMVNKKNTITLVNEALMQQFGYTREELVGQPIECLVPEAFRIPHPRHCKNFFDSLESREMGRGREVYARRKDGTQFHVEVALNPMTTEDGEFVLATVVDITEQKYAQQALIQSEVRSRLILNSAGEGIYGLDVNGKTTFVNPAAATMLGYSAEELIGIPMHATMHHTKPDGSPYPREECPMYAAFMDGSIHRVEDEILWRKDGTSFPVAYTSTPIFDENENIIGAVVTFADISERKATEQALLKWNQALTTSNQELDDFAYIASHDLKEPLRGIHNYSKILLEDHAEALNEDAQARCQTIIRLSRHMETLLDALLYFSRVGRSELAVVPTDLDSVLGNILESLDVSLKEGGILVYVPQIFPTVACDATRVGEIFRNLITNAMKYNNKSEKWIEIGYLEGQTDGDVAPPSLVFYVRDNGIGIQEKHLDSIFRIFKRLHGREKFGGGTGAGLTMTKKMIERHGGRIWVESIYEEGTTFYFTLERSQMPEGAIDQLMAISEFSAS